MCWRGLALRSWCEAAGPHFAHGEAITGGDLDRRLASAAAPMWPAGERLRRMVEGWPRVEAAPVVWPMPSKSGARADFVRLSEMMYGGGSGRYQGGTAQGARCTAIRRWDAWRAACGRVAPRQHRTTITFKAVSPSLAWGVVEVKTPGREQSVRLSTCDQSVESAVLRAQ